MKYCCASTGKFAGIAAAVVTALILLPGSSVSCGTKTRHQKSQQREKNATEAVRLKFRVSPPFSSYDILFGSKPVGKTDLYGGSVGIDLFERFALEGGGAYRLKSSFQEGGQHFYARIGYVPVVFDARASDWRGPAYQLGAKLGYLYLIEKMNDKTEMTQRVDAITLGAAAEYFHGFTRNIALITGLHIEGGWPAHTDANKEWQDNYGKTKVTLKIMFSIGIAVSLTFIPPWIPIYDDQSKMPWSDLDENH